jgi:uncharacterized protein (DUF1684 family)
MSETMSVLDVVDWRRRVFALYARVREQADRGAAHDLWQRGRDELFALHPASPLVPRDRARFSALPVLPYDPAWRFELEVSAPATEQRLDVSTGTDGVVPFELFGHVAVPGAGTLDVWRLTSYGGGLFIPVKDSLAGTAGGTYEGGRYVIDTVKGADLGVGASHGSVVIDFNFAYNPSCAYDPAWACPLAPPGNVLSVDIPVGETVG